MTSVFCCFGCLIDGKILEKAAIRLTVKIGWLASWKNPIQMADSQFSFIQTIAVSDYERTMLSLAFDTYP